MQEGAQTALIEAEPGDVIEFAAGTYAVHRDLSLDVDGVTIRGEGHGQDHPRSPARRPARREGLLVTADGFTIEDLAVEDTTGDGIKVKGADGVTFRRVARPSGPASPETRTAPTASTRCSARTC